MNRAKAIKYYNQGLEYYEEGQFELALECYTQAIKANPKDFEAYNNRGTIYQKLKQYEQALNDYNQAIKLNPEGIESYNNRGNTYSELEQYKYALRDYTQAIKLDPKRAEFYNNRGVTYFKLKQYEQALKDYDQAIKLNPNNSGIYNNRGNSYLELKQYSEAKVNYDKFIELTNLKENKKSFASLYYSMFLTEQQFELAEYYAHKIFEYSENIEEFHKKIYLDNIEKAKEINQKNQELEKAYLLLKEDYKAEVEENRRFKHLSAMASDIAHQINQPIAAMRLEITGARQRIIDGKFKPERINPLLDKTYEQLERLNNIITQFRSYANGNIECNIMNLNDIITKTIAVFNTQSAGHSIQLIPIFTNPSPYALVNAFLLQEILLNLLNNAKDALENIDNSTIWIRTWQTSDGRNGIDIEDNGTGVSPKVLETLFLPFSTTKTAQKGLGLGLFLARTNTEKLGGQLTYKPRENGGSCFSICFLNISKKELEHEQTI